jgi:hypothetical protein
LDIAQALSGVELVLIATPVNSFKNTQRLPTFTHIRNRLCVGIIRWCENNAFIVKQTALCCHHTILLFTRNGVCWNKLSYE